jgi:hypothetical protein
MVERGPVRMGLAEEIQNARFGAVDAVSLKDEKLVPEELNGGTRD